MTSSILWLREQFNWMGNHSGYDLLCETIIKSQLGNYSSVWKQPQSRFSNFQRRAIARLTRHVQGSPFYDLSGAALEISALWHCFCHRPQLVHVTYVENQLGVLNQYGHNYTRGLIGTAHQPASWWRLMHTAPKSICALDALIIPASCDVGYFEEFLPGQVYFIPHGVDTEFFYPKQEDDIASTSPRCVFVGRWLRDVQTLADVVDRVLAKNPGVQFDMVVPRDVRNDPFFFRIARHEQVNWYSGITDEQLRGVYQQASLLLLPLIDCTANNALLEAVACGLPIVSNRVGGVPDYTEDSFANLYPLGDVDGITEAVLRLVDSPQERTSKSLAARLFAEQYLNWDKIAAQTIEIYNKVSSNIASVA